MHDFFEMVENRASLQFLGLAIYHETKNETKNRKGNQNLDKSERNTIQPTKTTKKNNAHSHTSEMYAINVVTHSCIGLEDKLQVLVPETIRDLLRADIKVVVVRVLFIYFEIFWF